MANPEKNETYWKAGFCEAEWITYLNASDWSYLSPICDGITMGKPVTTLMNLWNLMNLTKFVEVQWSAYVSIVGQHSIFCQRSAGCGLPLATMVPRKLEMWRRGNGFGYEVNDAHPSGQIVLIMNSFCFLIIKLTTMSLTEIIVTCDLPI
jgi:hypothetical protein